MTNLVLSILMLAAFALVAGAVVLWRRGVRKQAGLMVLLALVALLNVAIWTVPDTGGQAPVDRLQPADR
ncbi:hypothetical protein WAB17_01270 [Parerythrobacter aurantius]|uniref:hypothetical protein n=1 Tax=Parerythrobacter aurantius TaxID=3127706 RepID=UPI0032523D95